jgi:O-antigen biosynthesis protein
VKTPKLSVVIVSYNVRHFLAQCLASVRAASLVLDGKYGDGACEVWVVDNRSVDDSVEMVLRDFPEVNCLAEQENHGFSRGNNLALRKAKGEYFLLLNPDTYIQEDTLLKVIEFMDSNPEAGGLGVKMLDGRGKFLPESKRGLPTPWTAFYKVFGLSGLFPKSRTFGRYHLGYLSEDENHEVDVLSGAFMVLRKTAIAEVGMLDETFFMYGEDIDLSYRLQLGGYKNYYFSETSIIHYKGESTKKASLNYVFVFYKAMVIFARKHFSGRYARVFSWLIHIAIWGRAGLSVFKRLVQRTVLPFLELGLIFASFQLIRLYWERQHIYMEGGGYESAFVWGILSGYSLVLWIFHIMLDGYKKPYKASVVWRSLGIGGLLLLVVYGLLPETLRYSRAILVFGVIISALSLSGFRLALRFLRVRAFQPVRVGRNRMVILGSSGQAGQVVRAFQQQGRQLDVLVQSPDEWNLVERGNDFVLLCRVFDATEVVFCQADMDAAQIMEYIKLPGLSGKEFWIADRDASCVIGSHSIHHAGQWVGGSALALSSVAAQRTKYRADIWRCVAALPIFLVVSPFMERPVQFWKNWFWVLSGKATWVGYIPNSAEHLPPLRPGVINPTSLIGSKVSLNKDLGGRLNQLYARDWRSEMDSEYMLRAWRSLGNLPG